MMTKPMNLCKDDGSSSDGDVRAISGLGGVGGPTWNSSSCQPQAATITEAENQSLTRDIVTYLKNPDTTKLKTLYTGISKRGPNPASTGPLLSIGSPMSGASEISIEIDSNTRISDIGSVIKVKNKRVSAFPDFIMDWLSRQTEEITTSLFTPPNLTIVPPTSF